MNANTHTREVGCELHMQEKLQACSSHDTLAVVDAASLLTTGFCMSQWFNAFFTACGKMQQRLPCGNTKKE